MGFQVLRYFREGFLEEGGAPLSPWVTPRLLSVHAGQQGAPNGLLRLSLTEAAGPGTAIELSLLPSPLDGRALLHIRQRVPFFTKRSMAHSHCQLQEWPLERPEETRLPFKFQRIKKIQ